jgi:hypothetical protein
MFEFPTHGRHPPVVRLAVHEEGQQTVTFPDGEEEEALERNHDTSLTAWMKYNEDHPDARKYRYDEFPVHYRWATSEKTWMPRKTAEYSISRVYSTTPAQGERHYLRMLLYHIPGATSFEDLRTHDGTTFDTYKQTATAMGLLDNDTEPEVCLSESVLSDMPTGIRRLFAIILVYCTPTHPEELWTTFKKDMGDDIAHAHTVNGRCLLTTEQLDNEILIQLQAQLENMSSSLAAHGMPLPKTSESLEHEPNVIRDEQYSVAEQSEKLREYLPHLNKEQRGIFEKVTTAVEDTQDTSHKKLFMVNSPGGCGKTFLFSAVLSGVRANGQIALAVAPTGLAAENLEGGRTSHSRFKIPIPINESSMCYIKAQTALAKLIRRASIVVWDEVMASHRLAIECVDRTFQDLRQSPLPFGGCVVLFGGDTRHILPVIRHGTEATIMDSSITRSTLWAKCQELPLTTNMRVDPEEVEFTEFLLKVGNGRHTQVDPGRPNLMALPQEYLLECLEDLLEEVYPNIQDGYRDPYFLASRTILTPLNEDVDKINSKCVESFPGVPTIFFSSDAVQQDDPNLPVPTEFLNSLTPSGMPPHKLELKKNIVVMLLRNLQAGPKEGLRNGTRLMVKGFGTRVVECEVLSGSSRGSTVFLPRIPFHLRDSEFPFVMVRKQFPIRPCFAMTINKAQGQTLAMVGLYLPRPVFAHGQLYVAFSRVRRKSSIKVCLGEDEDSQSGLTPNIVYHSIL